jgi:hypothetical protein
LYAKQLKLFLNFKFAILASANGGLVHVRETLFLETKFDTSFKKRGRVREIVQRGEEY